MRESGDTGSRAAWETAVLNGFAMLVILLMAGISLQVLFSKLDINPVARFDTALPLLGNAITLNSLLDFQWHLLAIIALAPAWLVWRRDGHVRVDFLYARQTPRRRLQIDTIGHLLFTTPFLIMSLPAAWAFTVRAYRSGEGSANAGLNDLYLIKAVLPVGLALLAVVLVLDLWRAAVRLGRPGKD